MIEPAHDLSSGLLGRHGFGSDRNRHSGSGVSIKDSEVHQLTSFSPPVDKKAAVANGLEFREETSKKDSNSLPWIRLKNL